MSPKELAYIEDALGHEQFLIAQCRSAAQDLTDSQLKQQVQQLMNKHQSLYNKLIQLV